MVLQLLMMMRWGNFQMRSLLTCLRGMMTTLWKKSPIPDYWQSIRWHFLFYACVLKKGGYKSLGGTDLPGGGGGYKWGRGL